MYNPCTLENHSIADLYYDATTQKLGFPRHKYYTLLCSWGIHVAIAYTLGCMTFLDYMGFVLAAFSFEVWP